MKKIKVYGKPGCEKCETTLKNVKEAAAAMGMEDAVVSVMDEERQKAHGITEFPTVVLVHGKKVVSGTVPTVEEMKEILEKARAKCAAAEK